MSADYLRETARMMRERSSSHGRDTQDFNLAVAAWLDEIAERQKPAEKWRRRSHGWTGSRFANAVARAWRGDA